MNKTNILHKAVKIISPNLNKSPTSKAEPQIYNGNCAKGWEIDNGTVNKLNYTVNKKRWNQGFPADLENA